MSLTTDRDDPRLGHGSDDGPVPQNEAYLVLPPDEIAKGFVRPLRRTYRHTGVRPAYPTRTLTDDEWAKYGDRYAAYEDYPDGPIVGRYWTAARLISGCGTTTTMDLTIAETYAREPDFYGATFCVKCARHLPVEEFRWEPDGSVLGS